MKECMHKSTHYTVKRLRLLKYLIDKGFSNYEVIPDPTNPKYNWFLFENTPQLEEAIEAYFSELNAKKLEAIK
jgi:predicted aspartyl protease